MIGETFGHYHIESKLGQGGMGVVYRAHDETLDRDVALKVLAPEILGDEAARARFHKEALALSRLNHANICTIYARARRVFTSGRRCVQTRQFAVTRRKL